MKMENKMKKWISGLENISKVTFKKIDDKNPNDVGYELLTEGINYDVMYNYSADLDLNKLSTNDVNSFAQKYGIEAGALTIKREIDKVFKPYGYVLRNNYVTVTCYFSIAIDSRHTSLIADYMTRAGGYRPFSRHGLGSCASPLQVKFLVGKVWNEPSG